MSSVLVALVILFLLPVALRFSYVGLYGWFWVSFMNPHRISYGPATDLPYAAIIGGATLLGWLIGKEGKKIPMTMVSILLIALAAHITVTTLLSHLPGLAWPLWERAIKIIIMALVTIAIIDTRERAHALIWIAVISFGYYGVKGGVFTLLGGGQARVWGPAQSFIGDNNALALALTMTFPFLRYLHQHSDVKWMRYGLGALMALFVFSIIGSQSRGAFLAIIAMTGFLILKSRHRVGLGIAAIAMGLVLLNFVPEKWVERMETIKTYDADASAISRLNAWSFSAVVANRDPLTGGGFGVYYDETLYFSIIPMAKKAHNAHSIYFEMLGQHGYLGLLIYLLLLFATWRAWSGIMKRCRGIPELSWAYDLASMTQVSLVAFMVGGAFQNLAFFDLYILLVSLAVALGVIVERELARDGVMPPASEDSDIKYRRPLRRPAPPLRRPGRLRPS